MSEGFHGSAEPTRGGLSLRRYIETTWLPNHVMELSTRERYTYLITKWILPELGDLPTADLMPSDVREWTRRLREVHDLNPPTIKYAKNVLDAVLTTALNDQLTFLHAGRGVKTPPVPTRPPTVLSVEQFDALYRAVDDPTMRLMLETAIESGLRWGELTELRVRDLDTHTGVLTVTRAVLHLKAATWQGPRFVVKDYPKDKQWRRLRLADHLVTNLAVHINDRGLDADDLIFAMPDQDRPRRGRRPAELPDPATLGLTTPNQHGRHFRHGTATAYGAGQCRCQPCRDSIATYRATRRASGKDDPRQPRTVQTDGHIGNDWFRAHILTPASRAAGLPQPVHPPRVTSRPRLLAARRRRRPPSRQGTPRPRIDHHNRKVLAHPPRRRQDRPQRPRQDPHPHHRTTPHTGRIFPGCEPASAAGRTRTRPRPPSPDRAAATGPSPLHGPHVGFAGC